MWQKYFRFISNSGQIDIRLQIHEKKKKKQKTDKPTDLFWSSIVVYRNSRSFRLGKKRSYDQSHWPGRREGESMLFSFLSSPASLRPEDGRVEGPALIFASTWVIRHAPRQSFDRKWFLFLAYAFQPHFSWPNRTTYVSVMPGRGGLRYVSLHYLSRSLIGLTIARVRMWISLAFLEGFHRVHVCDRIDADTGREREVRSVQVPLHFSFAIVLCTVGLKWGIHIITQRWAGSSPPWNPTEARVNYAAQGMAAVRRNLFTMPLAIYAYVWTSTYVLYMYIFSSLGNPAGRPHMSTFLVWLRRP